jgi:hypothetical protein
MQTDIVTYNGSSEMANGLYTHESPAARAAGLSCGVLYGCGDRI